MTCPYHAVILAAGRGKRISEETAVRPKALLPIGPRSLHDETTTSFLRRQCELLTDMGVARIVVVAGYQSEVVMDEVSRWAPGVRVVVNSTPDITTSGSLHSFQYAIHADLGLLDGRCQTLMMDADIVYHRRILQLFLESSDQSSLLVSRAHHAGTEEVLVYGTPDRPTWQRKGLSPLLVRGAPCLGEATGIVKFAPEDHALVRETVDWLVGDPNAPTGSARAQGFGPAKRATEHEELTLRLMHCGRMRAIMFERDLPFMEVDSLEEYDLLRRELYPRLLKLEAGATATSP